jgi:hypothetical protein
LINGDDPGGEWPETIGYIRPQLQEGREFWVLFDEDGVPLCVSMNRSEPFFYAAEHEVRVLVRH